MLSQPKINLFCVFGRTEQILSLKQTESENKYFRYNWFIYFVSERKSTKLDILQVFLQILNKETNMLESFSIMLRIYI